MTWRDPSAAPSSQEPCLHPQRFCCPSLAVPRTAPTFSFLHSPCLCPAGCFCFPGMHVPLYAGHGERCSGGQRQRLLAWYPLKVFNHSRCHRSTPLSSDGPHVECHTADDRALHIWDCLLCAHAHGPHAGVACECSCRAALSLCPGSRAALALNMFKAISGFKA